MKRRISFLVRVSVLLCSQTVWAQGNDTPPSALPAFSFRQLADASSYTQKSLPAGKGVVLFFFDPTCEHCQLQAQWVAGDLPRFRDATLLWVSTAPQDQVAAFRRKYFPQASANLVWLLDAEYRIDTYFGYSTVPSIYIYDRSGRLRQAFRNEMAVSEILRHLN